MPPTFRFWAPDGTRFTWTERRSFDAVLIGTHLADRDDSELRWDVSMRPSTNDTTIIDQRLVRVSFEHNGRTVVSGAPDALVELVVDPEGTLESVSGLEAASRALRGLAAAPVSEALVARMFSPAALGTLVRTRARLMLGDVIGRPTREGATWIVPRRPDGNARFTRYTVERTQPCEAAPEGQPTTCQLLRVWIDVDPRAADAIAGPLLEQDAREQGRPAPSFSEWGGGYTLWGSMLVQPATLLPGGASFRESGQISVTAGGETRQVQLHALTEDQFAYGPPRVASAAAPAIER